LPGEAVKAKFEVGDEIEAQFGTGIEFYSGKVTSCNANSSYGIKFDDGDCSNNVLEASIQRPPDPSSLARVPVKDARVAVKFLGGGWYCGYITKVQKLRNSQWKLCIKYDDGDTDNSVKYPAEDVRIFSK
jgi:hypothetical protein